MLDIFYDTRELFAADCALCNLDAVALLASGEYVTLPDGGIIASSML
jgi:hypothetical protein